ncbi:hypothetical protein [Cronobacter turicensis]|uniref:hypothetical protein n=1 Tax=Cronobacter turicensis TaxID=413502 RepID=UPI000CFD56A0|nr:hypothetical protein [Cronobacter turicensis]
MLCARLFERGEFGGAFIEFRLKRLRFAIQRTDVLLVLRGKRRFLLLQLRELFFQRALALGVLCACLFERGEFGGAFIEFRLKRLRFVIQRTDTLLILRGKRRLLFSSCVSCFSSALWLWVRSAPAFLSAASSAARLSSSA